MTSRKAKNTLASPSDKPRVLIVENDEITRFAYQELVAHWGYRPVLAEGDGKFLLTHARAQAKDQRCQLAVVDMRLIDDFAEDDKSGLGLIQQLKPAVCIMVSGRGDLSDARKAAEKGAAGFVGKEEGPEALREKLESEALKICGQKKRLKVEPVEILENLSEKLLGDIPAQYHDQLLDAFVRLFPEAQFLQVERIGTSHISSDFLSVPRPRSVVLRVREDDRQPVLVKLARVHKTQREIENFKHYIDGRLFGNFVPAFKGETTLWDIGGAKFSYIGTINQTFSNFFKHQRPAKIKQSLNNFFKHTWQPHYQQQQEVENISLFKLYCEVWERDWVDRINNFQPFHPEEAMGQERWEQLQAPNPLEWLKSNVINGRDVTIIKKTKTAVTHGDLHGDNMLVDDNNNIWVIDFERTKAGHVLQDFIELEADIINRLPCTTDTFASFLAVCLAVTIQSEIKALETDIHPPNGETEKALSTISHLRTLARDCTGLQDAREYLIGLLFNTVFRATIATSNQRRECLQRALMLASILCHRLEHWDEPWPPQHWQAHLLQQESI